MDVSWLAALIRACAVAVDLADAANRIEQGSIREFGHSSGIEHPTSQGAYTKAQNCWTPISNRLKDLERVEVVRERGLEPPRVLPHKILSLARLPVPPLPHRELSY